MKIIKNLFLLAIILAVIIFSFWASFMLSKNILVSAKKTATVDLLAVKSADVDKADKVAINPVKISFEVESVSTEVGSNADYMAPKLITNNDEAIKPKEYNYRVQSGIFSKKTNANILVSQLKKLGYAARSDTYGKYYRVFVLAENLSEARTTANNIKAKGYEAVISHAYRQAGRK